MSRRKNGWGGLLPMAVLAGWLAGPAPAPAATFPLDYRTDGESADFSLPLGKSEVLFKKEPEYAGSEVVRSVLYVSPDKKDYIGFACDTERSTLYLDLNRNLDLTDDPEGVVKTSGNGRRRSFKNVSLSIEQDGRRRDMVVDLQIYGNRWGQYEVKSSWESRSVVIGDQTYRVAIVDDGDGVITQADTLVLEPVDEFGEVGDDETKVELQAPASLVLDGSSYALAYALSADGKSLALSVDPGKGKLLDVDLTGKGVERLAMQDGATAAVFFRPGAAIRIPSGRYHSEVRVRVGDDGKHTSLWEAQRVSLRVRNEDKRPSWSVGGPIISKLTHSMAGNRLLFSQATAGVGGEKYSMVSSSGVSLGKPMLRVKKGGEVIHVGEFEYG